MNKKIDEYLNKISKIPLDKIDYNYIYEELICYNNRNMNDCVKDTLRVFTDMLDNNKKYISMSYDSIIITNTDNMNNSKRMVRLSIFNKLGYVVENIESIISFCNKKKISFSGKLDNYDNVGYLYIDINDIEDAIKVIDYINNKLSKNLYSVNPLFFSVGNVMLSISGDYSYIDMLARYVYRFIIKMKELNLNIDYNNFKDFMIDNYYKIDNQIDMYSYLDFNCKNIMLSKFFSDLYEFTNIILYLFNGNDIDEFKDYFRKLNRKNSKNSSKYIDYDNLDDCRDLFYELVDTMALNYGTDYVRDNVIKYKDTGNGDYITRKNNLRRRVFSSKKFMIFLIKIDLDVEIDLVIENIKFNKKKKILEDICKSVFMTYMEDGINYSKIQVARCLIRMGYGDYSAITRSNGARRMAVDNIDSNDVVKLIKGTLLIEHVKKEDELYELYANYIEDICVN